MSNPTRREFNQRLLAGTAGFLAAQFGERQPASAVDLTPPDAIWGKSIPFEVADGQTPFREIRIPDWLRQITRYAYTVPDVKNYQDAAAAGVQMLDLSFGDAINLAYPSKLLKRTPHLPEDHIPNYLTLCQKLGLRVTASVPPCLQAQVWAEHPDWRSIRTNTKDIPEVDLKQNPVGGILCQLSPWGDFLIQILEEILHNYPQVDGFGFDGLHHFSYCYCKSCRDGFRSAAGQEIPNVDLKDPVFRRYLAWRDRRMEAFVEQMQTRIRRIKPHAALVTWTTNAGRYGHFLDIPRNMSSRMNLLFDAPAQEFWLDETNRGNTIVPAFSNAYIWAVSNHRLAFSEPYMMSHGNPYGTDSFPPQEVLRRALLPMTYGANASISLGFPRHRESALISFREIRKRAPWLTDKQPEHWAGLVMSDQTRVQYGRQAGNVEERYLANVFGAFRAVTEEHLPTTVLADWHLNPDDLARFKVIVLPNTACLSDKQAESLAEYVKQGGGLVATGHTSLFREDGSPRGEFALQKILPGRYAGDVPSKPAQNVELDVNFAKGLGQDYWEQRQNIFDLRILDQAQLLSHSLLQTYVGDQAVTFKGPVVELRELDPAAKIWATVTPREPGASPRPAILASQVGKGRVVYFPSWVDAAYYTYPYPYQRILLAQAVRWAAAVPPSIEIDAPMCVHAGFFRQIKDGKQRLVVHLYNDLNSVGQHGKPNDDVPLREEIIPLHDIKIRFKDYQLGDVVWQPTGITLTASKTETPNPKITEFIVPQLEIHGMVVAELQ
jgi:hypothetical protein